MRLVSLALLLLSEFAAAAPTLQGLMTDPRLREFSAMAPVSYDSTALWAMNDGGLGNFIFMIGTDGKIRRQIALGGIENIDVEDMAAFALDGQRYLAIGDIGDNGGVRAQHPIYVIAEPTPTDTQVDLRWTTFFRYAEKRFDAEGMFVDAKAGYIYIVNKRISPPTLFRIPLKTATGELVVAKKVAELTGIRAVEYADDVVLTDNQRRYATQPTAAALHCNRREFSLLTYTAIYRYQRKAGQSWASALKSTPPQQIPLPPLPQAEALAYSRDCRSLFVGSEQVPAPFWRFDLP
jgi:hypothetical protein